MQSFLWRIIFVGQNGIVVWHKTILLGTCWGGKTEEWVEWWGDRAISVYHPPQLSKGNAPITYSHHTPTPPFLPLQETTIKGTSIRKHGGWLFANYSTLMPTYGFLLQLNNWGPYFDVLGGSKWHALLKIILNKLHKHNKQPPCFLMQESHSKV